MLFLLGTEMDYKADKMQAQFIFNNPNQISACGCGESVQLTPAKSLTPPGRAGTTGGRRWTANFLIDLLRISVRSPSAAMFSGFGISADGTNFALALRAGLYFRADERPFRNSRRRARKPFQYQTSARTVTVNSYWQLPARLFDDSEELAPGQGGARRRRNARRD